MKEALIQAALPHRVEAVETMDLKLVMDHHQVTLDLPELAHQAAAHQAVAQVEADQVEADQAVEPDMVPQLEFQPAQADTEALLLPQKLPQLVALVIKAHPDLLDQKGPMETPERMVTMERMVIMERMQN